MKKLFFLLLISFTASAQISINPLSKYYKRLHFVFDSVVVDKTHQILVICADSALVTFPDTAMLNAEWGTYQPQGYGYQPDDFQYSLDIRFNGAGTLFLSDSLYLKDTYTKTIKTDSVLDSGSWRYIYTSTLEDSLYVVKTLTPTNSRRAFRTKDNDRLWITYAPHTNKFFIYRKEEL